MSGIALKISSLVIRTLSKPIANLIKRQAGEHDGFKKTCISIAQSIHRIDMRLRLGLLQDTAAIEKQIAREAAEAAAKKHKHPVATVKTEAQTLADVKDGAKEKVKPAPPKPVKPRIRPLSEAKAIETGANFISETFLFSVAGALIVFESWRSRRKASERREDVADRLSDLEESEKAARRALVELEKEFLTLRASQTSDSSKPAKRILHREIWDQEAEKIEERGVSGLFARLSSFLGSGKDEAMASDHETGPAEKILAASDAALAEKHRKAAEELQKARQMAEPKKNV